MHKREYFNKTQVKPMRVIKKGRKRTKTERVNTEPKERYIFKY